MLHESLTPIFIVVLALAIRSESVSARRLAAVALGVSAVLLVLWPELLVFPPTVRSACCSRS